MALDGLKLDGQGGIVDDTSLARSLGMSDGYLKQLEHEVENILSFDSDESELLRSAIANILVTQLTHDERMCALHMIYQAPVATCSGDKLCRLQKKVLRKLKAVPELQKLWHLL